MKTLTEHIFERLKVSKNNISDNITLDTFKNGVDIFSISYIHVKTISGKGSVEIEYYSVEDLKGNILGYIELFNEGEPVYTLILNDSVYDYFCSEFPLEGDDKYGIICPDELYEVMFYNIPDFISESNIYLMNVSTWLDERDNLLSKNDFDYIKFRDTYREIKNKLSNNGNI